MDSGEHDPASPGKAFEAAAADHGVGILGTFRDFPLPLALLDADGRAAMVNAKFEQRYGGQWPDPGRIVAAAHASDPGWHEAPLRDAHGAQVWVRTIRSADRVLMMIDDAADSAHADAVATLRDRVAELEQLAATDHLTGAWNRAHLDRVIGTELARSRANRAPLSLVLFDIDHFKRINDTFGHAVGDTVLRELVQLVRSRTRASDLLFRWGGEEFVVLVPAAGYRRAASVAESLREAVAGHDFPGAGKVTISLGVAEHDGDEDPAAWFRRLDEALYEAKRGGRDRVVVARRGSSDAWAAEGGGSALHLVWQEGYECGEPTIDAEHRELFRLANALIDASLDDAPGPGAGGAAADALIAHVRRHFADEEAILERHGYDHLAEHRRAHAGLLGRAARLREQVGAGQAGLGAVVEFLAQDVVARHLIAADRAFFPLFSKSADASLSDAVR